MTKEKLSFKNGSKICYTVKENNLEDFYNKIIEFSTMSEEEYLVDLRLDYLINKKIEVKDIIDCITKAKKYLSNECETERQFIATLRNFSNGGNCLVDGKTYFSIIEELYEKSQVDAIDIDYDFYENKASNVKSLFSGKKTLMITYTCRSKSLTKDEYEEIFKSLIKTPAHILKVVTKAFSTDDTERLMTVARDFGEKLKDNDKVVVVISTGKLGILSRVWHEYTNTQIVYLDAYELDMVPAGKINKRVYDKCRKMISKLDEFSKTAENLHDIIH